MNIEDAKTQVTESLEKDGYYWRAIDSIVKETGIPEETVQSTVKQLIKDHQVVSAPRKDRDGRVLYTTRKHYRETRGFLTKLLSALSNQIV